MTTARSPLRVLRQQADHIAKMLKQASRGEFVANDPAGKITAARARESVTFAVVMDDKTLKIEMPWSQIEETSQCGISEWILNHMRESRNAVH